MTSLVGDLKCFGPIPSKHPIFIVGDLIFVRNQSAQDGHGTHYAPKFPWVVEAIAMRDQTPPQGDQK